MNLGVFIATTISERDTFVAGKIHLRGTQSTGFAKLQNLISLNQFILLFCKPGTEGPQRRSADHGNNEAMYRLAIYYLFAEQDDEQGWSWMESSADAGNTDAQQATLGHLELRTPEDKARAVELRQKWTGTKPGER